MLGGIKSSTRVDGAACVTFTHALGGSKDAIRKIMNQLEQTYLNKTVSYQHTIPDLGGVGSLIAVIRKGIDTHRVN